MTRSTERSGTVLPSVIRAAKACGSSNLAFAAVRLLRTSSQITGFLDAYPAYLREKYPTTIKDHHAAAVTNVDYMLRICRVNNGVRKHWDSALRART